MHNILLGNKNIFRQFIVHVHLMLIIFKKCPKIPYGGTLIKNIISRNFLF